MNYPPYPISKRIRRAICLLFVAGFFLVAPIITLYATGYRLEPGTFKITKTGVLSVDILPKDAAVYIDNTLLLESLPLRLPQMTPGTYRLEIRKDGYLPWVKDIVIEKNKTTYIKEVELFLEPKPQLIVHDTSITSAFPSPHGKYFIEKLSEENRIEYSLFDVKNKKSISLQNFEKNTEVETLWSTKGDIVAFKEITPSSTDFSLLSPERPNILSSFSVFSTNTTEQWTQNFFNFSEETLFVHDGEKEYLFARGKEQEMTTSTVQGVQFYKNSGGENWYIDINNDYIKKVGEDIAIYGGGSKLQKIIDVNGARAIVKVPNGMLVIERKDNQIKFIPCLNYIFDNTRKEYITWSDWELWTVYENGEVALLNRMSESIHAVRPLDESGELLIATDHKLLGFNPGYYVTHTFLNNVTLYSVAVDTQEKNIYFFGDFENKKGIYQLGY